MVNYIYFSIIHILCFYICCLKIKHTSKSKWVLFFIPQLFHIYVILFYGIKGYTNEWLIKLDGVEKVVDKIIKLEENENH